MAIEVFNRYENKFLLTTAEYLKVQQALTEYMDTDPYNKDGAFYTISNIYYDTQDNALIRNSLGKPKYKEKLRLRAYGVPDAHAKVYLEIKKKFKGLVNKRRTTLRLDEAYDFVATGHRPEAKDYMNPQVINEISYMLSRYELRPKLYLVYDRKAYFGKDQKDLRISFDTNIKTRRYDLRLEMGDYGDKLLPDDLWLMEIKAEKTLPMWLCQLLSENKIYSTSFSKYGTEYKMFVANHMREEAIPCLNPYLPVAQIRPYRLALQY